MPGSSFCRPPQPPSEPTHSRRVFLIPLIDARVLAPSVLTRPLHSSSGPLAPRTWPGRCPARAARSGSTARRAGSRARSRAGAPPGCRPTTRSSPRDARPDAPRTYAIVCTQCSSITGSCAVVRLHRPHRLATCATSVVLAAAASIQPCARSGAHAVVVGRQLGSAPALDGEQQLAVRAVRRPCCRS